MRAQIYSSDKMAQSLKKKNEMQNSTMIAQPSFNVLDFGRRWERARRGALEKILGPTDPSVTESVLLPMIPAGTRDEVLRNVFDNSRAFGLSATKHFGLTWELQDFQDVFTSLNNPCLHGKWEARASALVIERPACESVQVVGSFLCDYWREALDGLVVGLGEDERFSRHQSAGHGDSQCTDVIFIDKLQVEEPSARWKQIPNSHMADLSELQTQFQEKMGIKIEFFGIAEGVLYCKWSSKSKV